MNDLLGGKEAGKGELLANLPKTEARMPERAPRTFRWTCPKRPPLERQREPEVADRIRSRQTKRMRSVSAPSDVTEATTRREFVRKVQPTEAGELQLRPKQLQNAFHRLTPELSRPVAGRRVRAA